LERGLGALPRLRDVNADQDVGDDRADEEGDGEQQDMLLERPARLLPRDRDEDDGREEERARRAQVGYNGRCIRQGRSPAQNTR